VLRDFHSFGDDRPGANNRKLTNHSVVENDGVVTDQDKIANPIAVHNSAVANDDVIADNNVPVTMYHAIIFDTAIFADGYFTTIAADNSPGPYICAGADLYVPDHIRSLTDKCGGSYAWKIRIKFSNHFLTAISFSGYPALKLIIEQKTLKIRPWNSDKCQ
jgi:hypothetical protein